MGLAGVSHAGSFGVTPTRVDLDRNAKSAIIEVMNDDDAKLAFQAKLYEWHQSPDGRDEYVESQDLIYFPQLFTVNPKNKRIIRAGLKGPPSDVEKAYRLFIEETPEPEKGAPSGAQVRVVLRFGVPIFVAPASPSRKVEIESAGAARGKVLLTVRNVGNQSLRFEEFLVQRDGATLAQANGWYVLAGARRVFEIPIDPARCPLSGSLEVVASGQGTTLKRSLDAAPLLCERS
jgi:fimbrial chaperone protein